MIHSLTGFGHAAGDVDALACQVELRSVNHKGFKLVCRLPDALASLEGELEPLLREKLQRGSCVLSVNLAQADASGAQHINTEVLKAYQAQLGEAGLSAQVDSLLALPGVLEKAGSGAQFAESAQVPVRDLVLAAVDGLLAMRAREGQALQEDLQSHLDVIAAERQAIMVQVPNMVTAYRDRLAARVGELLAEQGTTLDDATLAREVAVFADRSDISEELARLEEHVRAFAKELTTAQGGQVGRRLDFLSQEMLREANTMGSKAADAIIAQRVVELKTRIDRIKEQVQNVV